MLTEAELQAKKEQIKLEAEKKAKEAKEQDSKTTLALQKTIENLTTQLKDERALKAKDKESLELEKEQERKQQLEAEANLERLLSDGNKEDDDKVDVDDLKPSEILDVVSRTVNTAIDAKIKLQEEEGKKGQKELSGKMDAMRGVLLQMIAKDGLDKARSKFKDFDKFKPEMVEVMKQYPGIEPQDAYILAKGKKAGDLPPKNETETEKPTTLAERAAAAEKRHKERKADDESTKSTRSRDFRTLLTETAGRVIDERKAVSSA